MNRRSFLSLMALGSIVVPRLSFGSSLSVGINRFGSGTYEVESTIYLPRGASLVGEGSGPVHEEVDNVYATRLVWTGPPGGTMLATEPKWNGTIQGICFDGAFRCGTIMDLKAPQGSLFTDLLLTRNADPAPPALIMSLDGVDFPSYSLNRFDRLIVANVHGGGVLMRNGATLNTFLGCRIDSPGFAVRIEGASDNNMFFGGTIAISHPRGGNVVELVGNAANECYQNNFYGTAVDSYFDTVNGIYAEHNLAPNIFQGCFLPQIGNQFRLGTYGQIDISTCFRKPIRPKRVK